MSPSKVIAQLPINNTDTNLKHSMRASRIPAHLLTLRHSFVDQLIDRRLNEGAGYALASSIPLTIVGQRIRIVGLDGGYRSLANDLNGP